LEDGSEEKEHSEELFGEEKLRGHPSLEQISVTIIIKVQQQQPARCAQSSLEEVQKTGQPEDCRASACLPEQRERRLG